MSEHSAFPHEQAESEQSLDLDGAIRRPLSSAEHPTEAYLAHVQIGAAVYGADGVEVAVVESVGPNHVVLLAGFPSRPVDVPASAIASVSRDGQRLDLRIPSQEIERLVSAHAPGYVHLQALQPESLTRPPDEHADRREP